MLEALRGENVPAGAAFYNDRQLNGNGLSLPLGDVPLVFVPNVLEENLCNVNVLRYTRFAFGFARYDRDFARHDRGFARYDRGFARYDRGFARYDRDFARYVFCHTEARRAECISLQQQKRYEERQHHTSTQALTTLFPTSTKPSRMGRNFSSPAST